LFRPCGWRLVGLVFMFCLLRRRHPNKVLQQSPSFRGRSYMFRIILSNLQHPKLPCEWRLVRMELLFRLLRRRNPKPILQQSSSFRRGSYMFRIILPSLQHPSLCRKWRLVRMEFLVQLLCLMRRWHSIPDTHLH
jgi:hypothetical protein